MNSSTRSMTVLPTSCSPRCWAEKNSLPSRSSGFGRSSGNWNEVPGMSLLQMSVTGGVMILAITVLRAQAMNHVPKKTFLALWGAALLRLVLPVSLSSTLSIYSLLGQKTALNVVDVPAAATPALLPGQAVAALPQIDAAPVQTISVWSIVWIAGVVLCAAFFRGGLLEMLPGVPHVFSSGQ